MQLIEEIFKVTCQYIEAKGIDTGYMEFPVTGSDIAGILEALAVEEM